MIKYFLVLFLLAGNTLIFSQELSRQQLDQMFNDYLKIKNINSEANKGTKNEHIKCGFSQVNSVMLHFNSFTPAQQQILKPLLTRPLAQTSIVSPSGFFRIHYDTTGGNTPKYYTSADLAHYSVSDLLKIYIDSVAIAADSSYNFEINYLGYPPPPPDSGAGGDNKYDIYIQDLGNVYGFTQFEFTSGDKGPSYMVVQNNFDGFPTLGIYAVRVTVAHEFHHGIQVGNYIYRDADAWFHELTSTSMEEFVYSSVNDYYNYLDNYFSNPERSIAENNVSGGDGYDLAIWNIFQKDKFGYGIIKRDWEYMPTKRAIDAISKAILDKNASFSQVLNEFGVWVYFTNSRAKPNQYFSEAQNYPLITFPVGNTSNKFTPPSVTINNVAFPVSNNFFSISSQLPTMTDEIVSVITNSDFQSALTSTSSSFSFQYYIYNYSVAGSNNLLDRYYAKLNAPAGLWFNSEILNGGWLGADKVYNTNADFPFPSPFNYGYAFMKIPVDQSAPDNVQMNVYSIGMSLVYSSNMSVSILNDVKKVVMWNGKNNNQQKLASGIYIVAVKSGSNVNKYKIVIFNE
jgi:hypothetical protein